MKKLLLGFSLILFPVLLSLPALAGTKHVIIFGGNVGIVYVPDSLTIAQGDTVEWRGDFSMHPLSSTTTPAGAPGWHAGADTLFDYIPGNHGTYNYHCDVHFSFGMVGKFIVSQTVPDLFSPAANAAGVSVNPNLRWSTVPNATMYHLELSTAPGFGTHLDILQADTVAHVSSLSQETRYYWRVRAINDIDSGNYSPADSFTTGASLPPSALILQGWNILSVPFHVSDSSARAIYPEAISRAFVYQSAYVPLDTLAVGDGFWLKFSQNQANPVSGAPVSVDTIDVTAGWNMVGSISTTIAASSIASIPPGIITGRFFGYTLGYQPSDSIRSGRGYWVKVGQSGKLVLSEQSAGNPESRIRIVPTSELPPAPPLAADEELPRGYVLEQNYPNPFNPSTEIKYQLPVLSRVRLGVYDLQGQLVSKLVDRVEEAGYKSVDWNASNFASGIYFYRLDATGVRDPGAGVSRKKNVIGEMRTVVEVCRMKSGGLREWNVLLQAYSTG